MEFLDLLNERGKIIGRASMYFEEEWKRYKQWIAASEKCQNRC